ncbi:50S ribosomal protein L19 [Candidatus Peribacteria bacterium]|nr:50S ribosomal protein L19 [Candidatus Peribacteria bacterium]
MLHTQAAKYLRKVPLVEVGNTVRVHERIKEGEKERTQIFEGLIIGIHRGHSQTDASFTVRRIVSDVGVEKVFPMHSPMVEKIEVKKIAKVRRARLNFLRGRKGKAARLSERFTTSDEFAGAIATPVEEVVAAAPAAEEKKE